MGEAMEDWLRAKGVLTTSGLFQPAAEVVPDIEIDLALMQPPASTIDTVRGPSVKTLRRRRNLGIAVGVGAALVVMVSFGYVLLFSGRGWSAAASPSSTIAAGAVSSAPPPSREEASTPLASQSSAPAETGVAATSLPLVKDPPVRTTGAGPAPVKQPTSRPPHSRGPGQEDDMYGNRR
jgi:hypothetical protein